MAAASTASTRSPAREARAVRAPRRVRPPVGHAVDGGGGQAEVGSRSGGAAEVGERRRDEGVGDGRQLHGLLGVLARPDQEPADLARGRGSAVRPARRRRSAGGARRPTLRTATSVCRCATHGIEDVLAGLALQLAQHGVGRHGDARQNGLDVRVDQAVSWSRSLRRNGRIAIGGMAHPGARRADAATGAVPGPAYPAAMRRIVLFGASGYTGGRAAAAMVARGLRPVLLGRDDAKLAALAERLGGLETDVRRRRRPHVAHARWSDPTTCW